MKGISWCHIDLCRKMSKFSTYHHITLSYSQPLALAPCWIMVNSLNSLCNHLICQVDEVCLVSYIFYTYQHNKNRQIGMVRHWQWVIKKRKKLCVPIWITVISDAEIQLFWNLPNNFPTVCYFGNFCLLEFRTREEEHSTTYSITSKFFTPFNRLALTWWW